MNVSALNTFTSSCTASRKKHRVVKTFCNVITIRSQKLLGIVSSSSNSMHSITKNALFNDEGLELGHAHNLDFTC